MAYMMIVMPTCFDVKKNHKFQLFRNNDSRTHLHLGTQFRRDKSLLVKCFCNVCASKKIKVLCNTWKFSFSLTYRMVYRPNNGRQNWCTKQDAKQPNIEKCCRARQPKMFHQPSCPGQLEERSQRWVQVAHSICVETSQVDLARGHSCRLSVQTFSHPDASCTSTSPCARKKSRA